MSKQISLFWFRNDLRISDNPGLHAAALSGSVLPIYILDDVNIANPRGAASNVWLHHSLRQLNQDLDNQLALFRGDPFKCILKLCERNKINQVFWNRNYEPEEILRDRSIKARLKDKNICVQSYNGQLLWEPWEIKKGDGGYYRVFTPFYKNGCLNAPLPRAPLPRPAMLKISRPPKETLSVESLELLPSKTWAQRVIKGWEFGETAAKARAEYFFENNLASYQQERDYPEKASTSILSPYLRFGQISPNQLWYQSKKNVNSSSVEHFRRELVWREFSYHLLFHFPRLPQINFNKRFDHYPWRNKNAEYSSWTRGQTGIPIVDAGMRELWLTGYMHNRVRMIVASFLVKNLGIDWRLGAKWFWDTLFDADLANNSASWQWVAGCGVDAAPFFRIFNPVTQAKKFDPDGTYIRRFVPELSELPSRYIGAPWEMPSSELARCGVVLGRDYPLPIVNLKNSREAALQSFKELPKS